MASSRPLIVTNVIGQFSSLSGRSDMTVTPIASARRSIRLLAASRV